MASVKRSIVDQPLCVFVEVCVARGLDFPGTFFCNHSKIECAQWAPGQDTIFCMCVHVCHIRFLL